MEFLHQFLNRFNNYRNWQHFDRQYSILVLYYISLAYGAVRNHHMQMSRKLSKTSWTCKQNGISDNVEHVFVSVFILFNYKR